MPLDDPIVRRIINTLVRPTAERARALYIEAQANAGQLAAALAQVASLPDDTVIEDGRGPEGIPPLTLRQLRECASVLTDLTTMISADPRLASVLYACVREVRVSE